MGSLKLCRAPGFFVPGALPVLEERIYASLAEWCGRAVPAREKRIYSITFGADSDIWTATVGLQLSGIGRGSRCAGGVNGVREIRMCDAARVLAIFAGTPYVIITNHLLGGVSIRSMFANPLLVAEARGIQYFSVGSHQGALESAALQSTQSALKLNRTTAVICPFGKKRAQRGAGSFPSL